MAASACGYCFSHIDKPEKYVETLLKFEVKIKLWVFSVWEETKPCVKTKSLVYMEICSFSYIAIVSFWNEILKMKKSI